MVTIVPTGPEMGLAAVSVSGVVTLPETVNRFGTVVVSVSGLVASRHVFAAPAEVVPHSTTAVEDGGGGVELIVYSADPTALLVMPLAEAIAFTVVVAPMEIGEKYGVEDVLGALPSSVKNMEAPDVLSEIDTICVAA
jgi:hypothetical protein